MSGSAWQKRAHLKTCIWATGTPPLSRARPQEGNLGFCSQARPDRGRHALAIWDCTPLPN
eukprot:92678-Alexandrium_andersonii.AAC.1